MSKRLDGSHTGKKYIGARYDDELIAALELYSSEKSLGELIKNIVIAFLKEKGFLRQDY
jgi:hypothetical protein